MAHLCALGAAALAHAAHGARAARLQPRRPLRHDRPLLPRAARAHPLPRQHGASEHRALLPDAAARRRARAQQGALRRGARRGAGRLLPRTRRGARAPTPAAQPQAAPRGRPLDPTPSPDRAPRMLSHRHWRWAPLCVRRKQGPQRAVLSLEARLRAGALWVPCCGCWALHGLTVTHDSVFVEGAYGLRYGLRNSVLPGIFSIYVYRVARATVRESRADVNGVWGGAPAAGGQRGLGREPQQGAGQSPARKKSAILGPKTATFSSRNGYTTHIAHEGAHMNDKSAASSGCQA